MSGQGRNDLEMNENAIAIQIVNSETGMQNAEGTAPKHPSRPLQLLRPQQPQQQL